MLHLIVIFKFWSHCYVFWPSHRPLLSVSVSLPADIWPVLRQCCRWVQHVLWCCRCFQLLTLSAVVTTLQHRCQLFPCIHTIIQELRLRVCTFLYQRRTVTSPRRQLVSFWCPPCTLSQGAGRVLSNISMLRNLTVLLKVIIWLHYLLPLLKFFWSSLIYLCKTTFQEPLSVSPDSRHLCLPTSTCSAPVSARHKLTANCQPAQADIIMTMVCSGLRCNCSHGVKLGGGV